MDCPVGGTFPVFSSDYSLLPRRCPSTHYQPSGQMSNQYKKVTCMYKKAKCEDEGEEICDEGNDTTDRMCRCDYTRGYRSLQYLLDNPHHRSCYQPKSNERGCVALPCNEGQELNQAYQCIPACPIGYFRPQYTVNCIPKVQDSSTTTKAEIQIPDKESKENDDYAIKDQLSEDSNVILIVCIALSIIAVITMSLILTFFVWKRKKNTMSRQRNGSDSDSRLLSEDDVPHNEENPSNKDAVHIKAEIHIKELHVTAENIAIGSHNKIMAKETSFQKTTSIEREGENLRKAQNSAFSYRDGDIIFRKLCGQRIGCITTGKGTGTGFRVGERYVVTAYHVVEDIFESLWKTVSGRMLEDGSWCLTDFIQSQNSGDTAKIGRQIMQQCKIKFGYIDENEGQVFTFSYDAPFVSVKYDIAILELELDALDRPLPPSLPLASINLPEKLHVLGHPGGGILQFDPACDIIRDENALNKIKREAVDLFTELGEKASRVKEEYSECKLSKDHILFHCSTSTAHGASGSPLIQIIGENPIVIGILLKGYPKIYYNKYRDNKSVNQQHPGLLIESGISMKMLKDLLIEQNLTELANKLFDS
ncbi:uncharacterized protein LOC125655555 isoform X2 [Ostrea edulis]|uniref:uncharacterized protein LOC125655555 isoform X2 n=1 Tax=Ostrea edulis TaxID=37623 RepID=UPI0024AEB995|nr:uncharacterized protein LOC125655555 isoform X2 [Ostrea edulis]XP_056001302.1 uncharacterized protein LOC125655555 isoform X2 [Ostrea edulis]